MSGPPWLSVPGPYDNGVEQPTQVAPTHTRGHANQGERLRTRRGAEVRRTRAPSYHLRTSPMPATHARAQPEHATACTTLQGSGTGRYERGTRKVRPNGLRPSTRHDPRPSTPAHPTMERGTAATPGPRAQAPWQWTPERGAVAIGRQPREGRAMGYRPALSGCCESPSLECTPCPAVTR